MEIKLYCVPHMCVTVMSRVISHTVIKELLTSNAVITESALLTLNIAAIN